MSSNSSDLLPDDYLIERFEIAADFERFHPKNDIFNRSIWDDTVQSKDLFKSYDIANFKPKKSKGFDHWDFALRNASWHLTDVVGERHFNETGRVEGFTDFFTITTKGSPTKVEVSSPYDSAMRVKTAARTLGAGSVGICALDKKWLYASQYNRKDGSEREMDLPSHLKYVIVIIIPMNYELGKTFPSALSGTTTGDGYARCLQVSSAVAQFITNLGYEAVASMNDTALNIPLAIQSGQGEYGRHGLLITPQFGPNVRIAKVFTDLPMEVDGPKEFGVKEFCKICQQCASSCPVKAIPSGPPQSEPPNLSSLKGITKWTVNAEKCFKFWVGMNTDCAICIRVCPYNKDYSKWWNRLGIKLANGPLRRLMLKLHKFIGFGARHKPADWWAERMSEASER